MTKSYKKTGRVLTALITAMFVLVSTSAVVVAQGNGNGGNGGNNGGNSGAPTIAGYCVWSEEEEHSVELLSPLRASAANNDPAVEEGIPTWRWRGSAGESANYFAYTGELSLQPQARSEWCLNQRTVTPLAVTFVDATCSALGTYTIPKFDGIEYYIDEEIIAAGTYTVKEDSTLVFTAKVMDFYFLDEDAVTEWTHKFVTPAAADCAVVTPPAVLGATTTVATTLAATTQQVSTTPVGAADAGGTQSATTLIGLAASAIALSVGAMVRRFSL